MMRWSRYNATSIVNCEWQWISFWRWEAEVKEWNIGKCSCITSTSFRLGLNVSFFNICYIKYSSEWMTFAQCKYKLTMSSMWQKWFTSEQHVTSTQHQNSIIIIIIIIIVTVMMMMMITYRQTWLSTFETWLYRSISRQMLSYTNNLTETGWVFCVIGR